MIIIVCLGHCYGLNVCVPSSHCPVILQIHKLKPNRQCDGTRMWDLWEWLGHEGRAL
jgi:hypothetical protein